MDISLVKGHAGGVEARRLHGDRPGKQEKDGEGGNHQTDKHCQEHGELPVGKQDPKQGRSLNTKHTQAGGVQTLFSSAPHLTTLHLASWMWRTSLHSDVAQSR